MQKPFKQLVLLILDGFGVASDSEGNAVSKANPKNINYLANHYPATTLQASGPSVGLPWGERGNSEVGHLNLGAGRIVSEDLPRISNSIASGGFFRNSAFLEAVKHVKKNDSAFHLVGLIGTGGVHSSEEHLYALLGLAKEHGLKKVYIHAFTDGRDSGPKEALMSLDRLMRKIIELQIGKVASVTGRFYSMDRGGHWEVTEKTYKTLVLGLGETAVSAREAIEKNYNKGIYDEVIPPTVITENGSPVGALGEGDSVIFFNFRPDRIVQLVRSLADPSFQKFGDQYPFLQNMFYVTMTQYAKNISAAVAFAPEIVEMGLSEVVSVNKMSQFHIAESEKYAHVTSFFNGGRENLWPLEEREIVSSPERYEKRYEDVPQMSADKITKNLIGKLESGTRFILANFANPDMVGHTGNREACIQAVQSVDKNIGRIYEAVIKQQACLVITADHGNIEEIIELRTGRIDKEHSLNPVPFMVIGRGLEKKPIGSKGYLELAGTVPEGVLSDVAPTVLELLGLKKPPEMTAISLLSKLLKG